MRANLSRATVYFAIGCEATPRYKSRMQYENGFRYCQSGSLDAFKRVLVAGLDVLLPPYCVLCQLPSGFGCLCRSCREQLVPPGPHCRRCGLPLSRSHDRVCGRCLQRRLPYDSTVYPLQYRFPADRLVQALKFNGQLVAGRILAGLMHERVSKSNAPLPDALVPVPLHAWRLFQRGFNQSHELAAHLSAALGIPLQAAVLQRRRHTRAQSGLDRKQRRRNLRGAFCWRGRQEPARHIALIDDVMTTGTTVGECARVLKKAGAKRVDVWVAARALPPGKR